MMRTDPSRAIASLRALPAEVIAAATAALSGLAQDLEQELAGTEAHGDITGATRASYRVYVVSDLDDGSAAASDGAAAADALNPGHSKVERYGEIGDDVIVVATGFTDYLTELHDNDGGAKDAISSFMTRQGPACAREAAAAIRRRVSG